MINAVIIEDEEPARARLSRMIGETDPSIQVVQTLDSVTSSIRWLEEHTAPDVLFMDVQLADGLSFEIFRHVKISCPVIFVTAFDTFAVQAFRVNGLDYLLKPVKREELQEALAKFKTRHARTPAIDYAALAEAMQRPKKEYQKRLVLRYGDLIRTLEVEDAAYFFTENKMQYVCTKQNLRYPLDITLDQVSDLLDPGLFYRINRQFIVNIHAIEKMLAVSKSRVQLYLNPPFPGETIVSTDRSSGFKQWLTGSGRSV